MVSGGAAFIAIQNMNTAMENMNSADGGSVAQLGNVEIVIMIIPIVLMVLFGVLAINILKPD
jgi:hypothetical protein